MSQLSTPQGQFNIVNLNDLQVVEGYEPALCEAGLDSLDALFACKKGEVLGKPGLAGWRERIRLTCPHEDRTLVLFLKRFTSPPKSALREAARCGAQSVAGIEWNWMRQLAADGIPCPRPIAFGQELANRREKRSAVLVEAVPGESLEKSLSPRAEFSQATLSTLIEQTATLIAHLHGKDYIHRDLYLSHLFYDFSKQVEQPLHLIDLQRVFRPTCFRERWIVKDLASLNYSTPFPFISGTDRLRWLKRYLSVTKIDSRTKKLIYRVLGKTKRIARHDRKRNARLGLAR